MKCSILQIHKLLKQKKINWIEVVGHTGALLSSITFISQVFKAWQIKSVGDLSQYMLLIVFTSTIIWLIYGFTLNLLLLSLLILLSVF